MPNIMEILSFGAELFHADGRTDRYVEAKNRFSQFCKSVLKKGFKLYTTFDGIDVEHIFEFFFSLTSSNHIVYVT